MCNHLSLDQDNAAYKSAGGLFEITKAQICLITVDVGLETRKLNKNSSVKSSSAGHYKLLKDRLNSHILRAFIRWEDYHWFKHYSGPS